MAQLNTRERFIRTLTGQDVDRVPFMKIFGGDSSVLPPWKAKYPLLPQYIDELLGFEGGYRGWRITPVNFWLSNVAPDVVLSEDDREMVIKKGDGSIIKIFKESDFHNQTMEYPVKDSNDWDRIRERHLKHDDPERIPYDWPFLAELYNNRDFPLQLTCGGVYGFLRIMMGDEGLCYAIYDDPGLVKQIISDYIDMCLVLWEILCKDVEFDLIECWEDMSSKNGSIISKNSFDEFLAPHYRRIREFANAHNIPIILVDSDGNINELAHWMYESGVNSMYPFEFGAGCDVKKTLKDIPGMSAIGCLEKSAGAQDDHFMEQQLEFARELIRGGRCIPGPDHFVLENVSFEQYKKFFNRLRDVIMTTKPGK